MKRLMLLFWLCVPACFGSYSWYYTLNLNNPHAYCQFNGSIQADSTGVYVPYQNVGTAIGSMISTITPPDGTSDYLVDATLAVPSGSVYGNYVIYLRATTNADGVGGPSGAGTYYAFVFGQGYLGVGGWSVIKSLNGTIYQLASGNNTALYNGMHLRAVARGNTLGFFVDGAPVAILTDSDITSGQPGIGGVQMYPGVEFTGLSFGPIDRTGGPTIGGVTSSTFPNHVDLHWNASTDANNPGLAWFSFFRNSAFVEAVGDTAVQDFTDAAVQPSQTYNYSIYAWDYSLTAAAVNFNVSTPPSGSIDPRQVGARPTGTYWGALGEQIDLRSGNLNYSLPLLNAQMRGGGTVPFNLTYNSTNWRQDPAGIWKLGNDVGYGFGWKLLAGSLTPYWGDAYTFDHYVFTDSSGAEYRLDQNNGGVWTSKESIYVSYDSNAGKLYFPDGSFWIFGCTSAGTEQDSGTMYPTAMEDSNGNQLSRAHDKRYYAQQIVMRSRA